MRNAGLRCGANTMVDENAERLRRGGGRPALRRLVAAALAAATLMLMAWVWIHEGPQAP
jgi:hypothetical protein